MTEDEFEMLASAIKASYPASKILADPQAMNFWYEMLSDIDYMVAQNAYQEYVAVSIYPPTIADIRRLCMERCRPPIPSFDEAWGMVQKAISVYGSQEPQMAFASMDSLTLSIVKNLGWTRLCQDENQVAARANFREAYETKAKVLYEKSLVPEYVKRESELLKDQYIPVIEEKETPCIEQNNQTYDAGSNITEEQWVKRSEKLERMRRVLRGEAE